MTAIPVVVGMLGNVDDRHKSVNGLQVIHNDREQGVGAPLVMVNMEGREGGVQEMEGGD